MVVRLLPDVEALVVAYLRADADVTALVGTRVGTELYAGSGAAVQVTLISGDERVMRHLDASRVQVDAWGGNKADASTLARTVRAALLEAAGDHAAGVITDVRTITAPRWLPDTTFTPPRARYTMDMEIVHHPNLS